MMRKTTFILTAGLIGLFLIPGNGPWDASAGASAKAALLADLKDRGVRIGQHRRTRMVNFIGTDPGTPVAVTGVSSALSAQDSAMAIMQSYGRLFGIKDAPGELRVMKQLTADDGRSMVRYQQLYQGVPVIGGELIVNMNADRQLLSLSGEASPKLSLLVDPQVAAATAGAKALAAVAKWHGLKKELLEVSVPELSVYDPRLIGPSTFPPALVWRMEVTPKTLLPIREFVLVDAQRGNISLHFNQVHTAKNRETYDANNLTTLPGTLACNEASGDACTSGADTDADAAHLYAGDTYDFYNTNHARDSLDNAGMTLISTVHYGVSYQNAFWSGTQMVYGDGFPLADDVVGHELTHGVTQNTSNLFYYYQSGAISESFSDVWGEFVDLSNTGGTDTAGTRWQMGEDIPSIGAIRDMSDPTIFGDPDRMTSANYVTGSSDSGGVHSNSGVNNKAVYLLTDGGSFNGKTVTALGITKVAKIYYEAQTTLLVSGSDYLDLYNALYQGCLNLVGTAGITAADCTEVRDATDAVEMDQEPTTGFNPEATVCPTGQTVNSSFFDDFESGLGNWTLTHDAGLGNYDWFDWYAVYGPSYGPYATSGLSSLFGENVGVTADQYARITVNVPNISGHTPYLYFKHAFDFENSSTAYDGGVLEYSTNGGSTWVDAGGLIDSGQAYTGTVDACCSNPLAGRSAFTNASHGYVSTRVSLGTLAGQTVDLRWRVGTDFLIEWWGWWVDDVQAYSCNTSPVATAQSLGTPEDTALTVTLSGSDADGDPLNYSITTGPSNGVLTGTAPNLTYTPNANYFGSDSLTFSVDDGAGGSDSATVNIAVSAVNDLPTISAVSDQTIDEDTDTGVIAFTIGDVETIAGSLIVTGASSNTTLAPNTNIAFGGSGTSRTVTVTPAADQNGTATITLTVDDGTDSTIEPFVLTVTAINDVPTAPNLVAPASAATGVDSTSVTFDWDAATDVDGDLLTYELQVCEDVALSINCITPVVVSSLTTKIYVAGLGGGGLLLLGFVGVANRRRLWLQAGAVIVAGLLLGGCGSSTPDPTPTPTTETTVTGLSPNTTYYWKVAARDGNGGETDSAIWSFTTAP